MVASRPKYLKLHPADNVAVILSDVAINYPISIDDELFSLSDSIPFGHKFAVKPMSIGEKVIKFGTCIGIATQFIQKGEHVHLHNIKSNYMPTHTLNDTSNG